MKWKIIQMFQTTNQIVIELIGTNLAGFSISHGLVKKALAALGQN